MAEKEIYEMPQVAIRLVEAPPLYSKEQIGSPDDAIRIMAKELKYYDREVISVVNINTNGQPINFSIVSVGELSFSIAHPREILKSSILSNAASVIVLHNHPSGNIKPSREDIKTTEKLQEVYDLIGIKMLDHIIIGAGIEDKAYSIKGERTISIEKEDVEYIQNDIDKRDSKVKELINEYNEKLSETIEEEISSIGEILDDYKENSNEVKTFNIEVTETLQKVISIEAHNLTEAIKEIDNMYDHGDIILDSNDYIDTNINPTKETLDMVMGEEIREKHTMQSEKNKIYITLPKGLCRQMDSKRREGEKFNSMVMPSGVTVEGKDLGGSIINPLYMNENKSNPKEYTAVYYLDSLKDGKVRVTHKDGSYEKVSLKKLKEAIDEHQEEYKKKIDKNKETSIKKNKIKDEEIE